MPRRICRRAAGDLARRAVAAVEEDDDDDEDDEDADEHEEDWPAIDARRDLWDAMEGQEGLTISKDAKGYLAALFVSRRSAALLSNARALTSRSSTSDVHDAWKPRCWIRLKLLIRVSMLVTLHGMTLRCFGATLHRVCAAEFAQICSFMLRRIGDITILDLHARLGASGLGGKRWQTRRGP